MGLVRANGGQKLLCFWFLVATGVVKKSSRLDEFLRRTVRDFPVNVERLLIVVNRGSYVVLTDKICDRRVLNESSMPPCARFTSPSTCNSYGRTRAGRVPGSCSGSAWLDGGQALNRDGALDSDLGVGPYAQCAAEFGVAVGYVSTVTTLLASVG
jgi:hypothetical protein